MTLRSWVHGRCYLAAGEVKRCSILIHLDDCRGQYLSFINLGEAHVLAAMCRRHGVRLPKVRRALDYVRQQLNSRRPLMDEVFQTDALDLFVEQYGDLINVSRVGQQAMRELITAYLRRIERDSTGMPVKLYPFTRDSRSPLSPKDDPRVIVMNQTISFGRLVIVETGTPVSAFYERYIAGDSGLAD